MRSLTSVYQLLPLYPAIKIGNEFVRVTETDQVPNVIQSRAQDARNFHDEIFNAVTENEKEEAYRNNFITVPVIGIKQPTLQSAEMIEGKLVASQTLPAALAGRVDYVDGDGTVPKISAIPNELSKQSRSFNNRFISESHGALQNQEQILQCVKEAIATTQFEDAFSIRAMEASIGLAVDDLYLPEEPLALQASVTSESSAEVTGLQAVITPVAKEGTPLTLNFEQQSEQQQTQQWALSTEQLPAGRYRVVVNATGNGSLPDPVHNMFEVAGPVL